MSQPESLQQISVLCYSVKFFLQDLKISGGLNIFVSADRYIATTTLAIIAVFLEYLGQFVIDLHQIYTHSSVPKNTSPCNF